MCFGFYLDLAYQERFRFSSDSAKVPMKIYKNVYRIKLRWDRNHSIQVDNANFLLHRCSNKSVENYTQILIFQVTCHSAQFPTTFSYFHLVTPCDKFECHEALASATPVYLDRLISKNVGSELPQHCARVEKFDVSPVWSEWSRGTKMK